MISPAISLIIGKTCQDDLRQSVFSKEIYDPVLQVIKGFTAQFTLCIFKVNSGDYIYVL
jgi:hypothetical protein